MTMKYITTSIILTISCLLSTQLLAVKILECVDENGNSAFQDRCPPGTTVAGEKKFYTGKKEGNPDSPDVPITLYTVPTCDACDVVRNILEKYGANVSEKNVESDVALQQELQKKSGATGTLSVPTVIVGEKVIVGYNKQDLVASLEEAGFKQGGTPAPGAATSEEAVEEESQPDVTEEEEPAT